MSKVIIRDGVPTMEQYQLFTSSSEFRDIEKYSNNFIKKVGQDISSYNRRWVPDPLHQWSRQWEYPFVIQAVKTLSKKNLKVLDLGAGMTFLPYYLMDEMGVGEVKALDYDRSLVELYKRVNKKLNSKVNFSYQDIRELDPKNEKYDIIYSVSVLEHTDQYESIIKSCYKLLKPGGIFCLTFDISVDGHGDIPLPEAKKLLRSISKTFKTKDLSSYLMVDFQNSVTSDKIAKINKNLMPWKYPALNVVKPILGLRGFGRPYKNLAFCCLSVKKGRNA